MPSFNVSGAGAALGNISRNDYLDYKDEFGEFEDDVFDQTGIGENDPRSLVSGARRDSRQATGLARAVGTRNRSRFGISGTRDAAIGESLGGALTNVDSANRARGVQRNADEALEGGLYSIGQNINRSATGALGSLANIETQERNASRQRKASNRARNIGIGGSVAGLAAAFL